MQTSSNPSSWPDYRAVWRWHFYASLFSIPFVIILSITGAIYLFKPQIDAWEDRKFDQIKIAYQAAKPSEQVQAAMQAIPGGVPTGYELPQSEHHAARVLIQDGESTHRVFVHPETLDVLHVRNDRDTIIRQVRAFHGQLGMGERGSNLVELAASWTIVMLLTGVYLWWPRSMKGLGGVIYPRLTRSTNLFWRDLHSVTGVWITAFALFLLATGLPWAKFWGSYFKTIRSVTGTAVVQQDWTVGGEHRKPSGTEEHQGHAKQTQPRGRGDRRPAKMPSDLTAFDRVVATVAPLQLAYPAIVSPPRSGSGHWTVKSDAQNRTLRTTLTVNPENGDVVAREDFSDRHWVDQAIGIGIAAHEGQLFGWFNQLLGLLTAVGLVLLCLSGYVMWWRRRSTGVLGAPERLQDAHFSVGLVTIIIVLGAYIPLFGISLIAVLLLERFVLRRIPRVQHWLGLQPRNGRIYQTVASVFMMCLLVMNGCGNPEPVAAGSRGNLSLNGQPLVEVELSVYRDNGTQPELIGKGTVDWSGHFELRNLTANEAIWLEPGKYKFTVESVGNPIKIPADYRDPNKTPLKYESIDAKVPVRLDITEQWKS